MTFLAEMTVNIFIQQNPIKINKSMKKLLIRQRYHSQSHRAQTSQDCTRNNKLIVTAQSSVGTDRRSRLSEPTGSKLRKYHSDGKHIPQVSQVKSKRMEPNYNKWYIKPTLRMKQVQSTHLVDKRDSNYVYKQLYSESEVNPDNPFEVKKSQKFKLLELLPKNKFLYLEQFRKTQMKKKKRVPEIVEMLARNIRARTEY